MKAIQTRYAGYLFRSRLEARWAVFFDTLGLKWEYEPEGFDLGDGVYYLPDFRVTYVFEGRSTAYWCEVKPDMTTISSQELEKMVRFASHQSLLLLDGAPAVTQYIPMAYIKDKTLDGVRSTFLKPRCHGMYMWSDRLESFDTAYRSHADQDDELTSLRQACEKARSYRFGQDGKA